MISRRVLVVWRRVWAGNIVAREYNVGSRRQSVDAIEAAIVREPRATTANLANRLPFGVAYQRHVDLHADQRFAGSARDSAGDRAAFDHGDRDVGADAVITAILPLIDRNGPGHVAFRGEG